MAKKQTAKRKVYHVTRKGKKWVVKRAGAKRISGSFRKKSRAIEAAKRLAKRWTLSQVVVHGRDGKVQTEYTYGKDPFPPRG